MLFTLGGKQITSVPHSGSFAAAIKELGAVRVAEVRAELSTIIDSMAPEKNGSRTFSISHLGSKLSPWPAPISHLYHIAWVFEGQNPDNKKVEDRAALLFGLFVWECIIMWREKWVFWDPNLSGRDPNREIMGKVYFERV